MDRPYPSNAFQTDDDLHRALSRVVVVGTTCSGKTTFANRLAVLLDAPHVELDALAEARG